MSANPTPPTRDRLLDAAAELFYREGVGVGVDALCKAAGVSKRSMYQLFESKDAVIAASLERAAPRNQQWVLPAEGHPGTPREQILDVFERLDQASAAPTFHGCPFVATAMELKDPTHPASLVARRSKDTVTQWFSDQARLSGARDPEMLAQQLTVVFDGAGARAVVQGSGLNGLATATATALLDAGGAVA